MSDSSEKKSSFAQDFERRLDELITWAVANSPNQFAPLTGKDFSDARDKLRKIAIDGGDPFRRRESAEKASGEPEPSEGGAQYVSVTPNPWP